MTTVGPVVQRKADQGREWRDGVEPVGMSWDGSKEADVETDERTV